MSKGSVLLYISRLKKFNTIWKVLSFLLLVLLILSLLPHSKKSSKEYIASVSVKGFISSEMLVFDDIKALTDDENVKGVIIECNTGGGSATASEMLYSAISKLAKVKPTVVSITDMCASGGYLASLGAAKITSYPSSIVGSIGVLMRQFRYEDAMKKVGFTQKTYSSGKFKAAPNPAFNESDPEVDAYVQDMVAEVHEMFKETVKAHREITDESEAFSGKIFSGNRALSLGLIDTTSGDPLAELITIDPKLKDLQILDYQSNPKAGNFIDAILDKLLKRKYKSEAQLLALYEM